MAQKILFVSDLTGKDIGDDSEHASLVILSHPTLDSPVRLDAHALEAANLKDESVDLVQVEIHLPGYDAETVWIPLTKFDKLFGKDVDSQAVLEAAEPVRQEVTIRRRGRPSGSVSKPAARKASGSGRTPEELNAIRDWARSQGMDVASRGRVRADIILAFDQAHKS